MPLESLVVYDTQVSDITPLEDCKSLTVLNLGKLKLTPASVVALQAKLANCKIEWDDPAKTTLPQPTASGTK